MKTNKTQVKKEEEMKRLLGCLVIALLFGMCHTISAFCEEPNVAPGCSERFSVFGSAEEVPSSLSTEGPCGDMLTFDECRDCCLGNYDDCIEVCEEDWGDLEDQCLEEFADCADDCPTGHNPCLHVCGEAFYECTMPMRMCRFWCYKNWKCDWYGCMDKCFDLPSQKDSEEAEPVQP